MTTTASNVFANAMANAVAAAAPVKKENYSPELTAQVVAAYAIDKNLENLAAKFGKSVKSLQAKLSREKVYVKKEYVTKTGEVSISKEEIVADIAKLLGKTDEEFASLEKATKPVLQALQSALQVYADIMELDTPAPEFESDDAGTYTSMQELAADDGVFINDTMPRTAEGKVSLAKA